MKRALDEYCWKKRTKPSPFILSLIEGFLEDPASYAGALVPPAGKDYASVYIKDEVWLAAGQQAEAMGTRLSAVVRVGIANALDSEGILWDATTPRPRNEHIPVLE